MGSVVPLNTPFRQTNREARVAAAIHRFAATRRRSSDVFWLKENAELIGLIESSGVQISQNDLGPHLEFYAEIDKKLAFFPQYYRFFLSLALDLEDLGLPGDAGGRAAEWVAEQGLAGAELNDLQRAEARRLCARRGVNAIPGDEGLDDRLRNFGSRCETFSLPNKKAAYELTHIVFYLSEYGRRDPLLPGAFIQSLRFSGTLAFLELNIDLLAEICIALRFAGATPPRIWENWLTSQARRFVCEAEESGWMNDDYHPYLMVTWHALICGTGGFGLNIPEGPVAFRAPPNHATPLRELSECMFTLGGKRRTQWSTMRVVLDDMLTESARDVVAKASEVGDFEQFFEGFARVDKPRITSVTRDCPPERLQEVGG
ncbi:MAG: hypothetical protein AAF922_09235 [Pseudomonadota bacterium]